MRLRKFSEEDSLLAELYDEHRESLMKRKGFVRLRKFSEEASLLAELYDEHRESLMKRKAS